MCKLSLSKTTVMGKHDRCCVGPCDNDKYLTKLVKRGNIKTLKWHRLPIDPDKRKEWEAMIQKGRQDFVPGSWSYVCSNHFVDGEPTRENPRPTLYLTASEMLQSTPRKRKYSEREGASKLNNEELITKKEMKLLLLRK